MPIDQMLQLDTNEFIKFRVKRHPIGSIPLYFFGAFVFLTILSFNFFLIKFHSQLSQYVNPAIFYIIVATLAVCSVILSLVSVKLYFDNELVITNEHVIQLLRPSLFGRKVSQLSLEKIQDVTVRQRGLLPSIFKYGDIMIETAGEEANFVFALVGHPFITAKQIMEVAEEYAKSHQQINGQPLTYQ